MKCRNCGNTLQHLFVDLGYAPPSNAYMEKDADLSKEQQFPLQVYVCEQCWLVQTRDYVDADKLFNADYAYFSSISSGWLEHAKRYVAMIIERQRIDSSSLVIEIASNDGYLLKNFVASNIPCLGIEPTTETANAARELGIPVLSEFFGSKLAKQLSENGQYADLIIGNNVLAHVPDIKDFVAGLKILLKPKGVITLEFPHLLELIKNSQFDTIYHEHFSYLSLSVVQLIFDEAGLDLFEVEELPTHGGSLRIYCAHKGTQNICPVVADLIELERENGLQSLPTYLAFQQQINQIKEDLCSFLSSQKALGKTVYGYGAAAKGNTLLNYAGISTDLLPVICDAAPSKQGKLMPGSHIPIHAPEFLQTHPSDFVLILPWNIKDEVINQLSFLKNTRFVTAIPYLEVSDA
jgi:SAM-dependent methyltransferase